MQNYWLSEFDIEDKNHMGGPDMVDPEDDMPEDDGEEDAPKGDLNDRQHALYKLYEMTVEEYGMFDKTSRANGSHYTPADANPFKEEGLICSNCSFFQGKNACELVTGKIQPEGICKLWIIPEELIKKK